MDQDERRRKVEAGRAKLTQYRQQRAKGNSTSTVKKTVKKKIQTVRTNDQSVTRGETPPECSDEPDDKEEHEELVQPHEADDPEEINQTDSLPVDGMETHQPGEQELDITHVNEELLEEFVVTHTSKEQLKQLQAAVEKRNEIISQLTTNLQGALMSRDQVQLEAQQLTGQIQELQQQLQQAKEYLRSKSIGWLDLSLTQHTKKQLHIERSLQITNSQQVLLAQKETEITALQQQLMVMKDSLSQLQSAFTSKNREQVNSSLCHNGEVLSIISTSPENNSDLIQRLKCELDEERQNSKQAHERAENLQEMVLKFESEKVEIETRLQLVQDDLEHAQKRALEAQQYKAEKERLNQDVVRLDVLVQELQNRLQEEEELSMRLRSKYEAEISNWELRLQTLEEEKVLDVAQLGEVPDAEVQHLPDEHFEEFGRIQELLAQDQNLHFHSVPEEHDGTSVNWFQTSEHNDQDTAPEGSSEAVVNVNTSVSFDIMERYLASAAQHESSVMDESLEEHSIMDISNVSRLEFEDESRFLVHLDSGAHNSNPDNQPSGLNVLSFTQVPFRSFSSTLNGSNQCVDLGKQLLIQQCADLTDQLEEKLRQLDVLQAEVRCSAEELEEARDRWSKASQELEEAKWELVTERDKRLRCEELLNEKIHQQDNLKNKLSYLQSQNENQQLTSNMDFDIKNSSIEELLQEDKLKLVLQLKHQEQLVRDIQEQKTAGDSVSCEVQSLFGQQVLSLKAQRDQPMAQLEDQMEKNRTTSVLLEQKTVEVDCAFRENARFRAEGEQRGNMQRSEKVRVDLESEMACLKENLRNMEEALRQGSAEKADLEKRVQGLEERNGSMEKVLEMELENFELQLGAKDVALDQMKEAREKAEYELMEKENAFQEELREYKEERKRLEEKHQQEVLEWSVRLEHQLAELRCNLEEEQKKHIVLIKQVHEREHEREMDELAAQQRQEVDRLKAELSEELRDSMEAAHQAELSQVQMQHALELEALRLSLTNLHTAQLELTQSNLQKEKEAALSELQASLREKWTQENAMLQTRQQFELERLREQNREQERRAELQLQLAIDDLNCVWEKRISEERTSLEQQQASGVEDAKTRWLEDFRKEQSALQAALCKAEENLAEMQCRFDELQKAKKDEIQHLEVELNQAWSDRDAAARAVEELVASHKVVLQEQQLHTQELEEKEKQLQLEVDRLLTEQEAQKATSEQEISNLWSQMESMRTSRQELGELKEQLLARTSRVDDIERLKQEFSQQRKELQEQNEGELENLRVYFEQRLQASEENHREEITLLQLRLVEGLREESVLKTGAASSLSDEKAEEGRVNSLAEITEHLEKHKMELDSQRLQLEEKHRQDLEQLRCNMALSYREELLQARAELTDRYYCDMEQLQTKHALEIEQLRAKLSDSHLKEITKLRLQSATDVARQVEAELDEKTRLQSLEHQAQLAQLASATENILRLEKELAQLALQHSRELERVTERHAEELRELEDGLKKSFAEELHSHLMEARQEERNQTNGELSRQNTEEQLQLRARLQAETEDRMCALREELQHAACEERKELEQKLVQAEALLAKERQRQHALQLGLDSEESPQDLALIQRLKAQYASELQTAKNTMAAEVKELNALLREQAESRLQEAACRHKEEQQQLMEELNRQREEDLQKLQQQHAEELQAQTAFLNQNISKLEHLQKEYQELKTRHQEALELLSSNHKTVLDSLAEKHRAELDKLQVVLQETNIAQLEAKEAELTSRHKQEMDELETRMLCNMDTLESTYLKQIQVVCEDKEDALRATLEQQQVKEIERVKQDELTIREELRKELARVHMEKFSAMATELGHAHQAELSAALASQKAALESDYHSTLETLRQHILDLETQHGTALHEITDLATKEKQQLNALNSQHQQQLQELKAASSREMEALRRELEEEASRQRLHILEEAELLKCQSEEQLQQKIVLLKEESKQEKTAAINELERTLREQHQQNEIRNTEKMNQLTAQLQQLDTVVSQLRAEVSGLQGELDGKRSEMDTLETLLQRRERESQEGANLLNMLRDDLSAAIQQRQDLQMAHDRLQQLTLEMLRITIATEEEIGHRLGISAEGDWIWGNTPSRMPNVSRETDVEGGVNCSTFSSLIDEGLELSQRLCESLFSGPDGELDPEREELVLGSCTRLRAAVDKLLEMVSDYTGQLEQLRALQATLDEQFGEGGEVKKALLLQHDQLLEQLDQEASVKSQLQLELHKAEGLMEGYMADKATLEETLQKKEAREQSLVKELDNTRARLQELGEEHSILQRQRDAISASLGEPEKALLAEAKRLGQERVDVQRQADKDRVGLAARVRLLEQELEESESRTQQQEEQHRAQTEDLQQHISALEKQLKHHRQFIDEQAVEREHERDEFQQEIKNLEAQLRVSSKGHTAVDTKGQRIEDLVIQVESLQALIKDKTEDYSVLLLAKEQCQRDLEDRNEEIDKMVSRIRELEQALLSNAEAGRAVTQLEQELQKAHKSLQELSQDKEALQQQLYSNKLQISALQSKLDETRHRFPDPNADPDLREQLETLQQDLQNKGEQEVVLLERVQTLEKALAVKEEDIRQLTLQLELKINESRAREEELNLHITELQEAVKTLRRQQQEDGNTSALQLPAALLEEKNLEIDHLNQQLFCLQQELDITKENKAQETQTDMEDLRAQVERLRGDQERLRQAKEEEAEQLHEVIHKLQEELSQIDPNRHEVSDPNTDSPEPPDFPWSPRKQHSTEESLCHELSSQTLQNYHTKLSELQMDLERLGDEKEALGRLLLSQEEQYGQQVQTLGRSLGEERGKLVSLEQEAGELKLQLGQKEAEVQDLQDSIHKLEEGTRNMKELELQFRKAEERRKELQQEMARLSEEALRHTQEREKTEGRLAELQQKSEDRENTVAQMRLQVTELEKTLQQQQSAVAILETSKKELYTEKKAVQKREAKLQEEIERLQQEVTEKSIQIQEVNTQLEERVREQEQTQTDVLTCAEETLAKAEAALREKEEQLNYLRLQHDALRAELAAVKEGLSTSTERAEKLQEEGQTKDRALADLEEHNQHLRAELRGLQDDLEVQEEELAYQQRELEELRRRYNHQEHAGLGSSKPEQRFLDGLSHNSSLSSPEVLRRLDCSEERPSHLHASHLSELSSLRNTSLEMTSKPSPIERNDLKRPLALLPETDPPSRPSHSASPRSLSMSENISVLDSLDADKAQDLESLGDVTPSCSPSLSSTSQVSVPEIASDGYGSNVSSELEAKLRQELEHTERLDAHFVEYLRRRDMAPASRPDSAAGSLHHTYELLSPELQEMLNRVYRESCRVLSLSHRPTPAGQLHPDSEDAPPPSWQQERRALQETVLSLRQLLCRMAERDPKVDGDVDWRKELMQAVRSVFDSERTWLHSQLQDVMASTTGLDYTSLLKHLEALLQKQEEQQRRTLEQLLSADRNSLLAEIRSLHEQLQNCTLQSQEHLRELQSSLSTVREEGAQTQQQLHRQVSELGRQLQQAQAASQDMQRSLEEGQSRSARQHCQLEAEQKLVVEMRVELEERAQQLLAASKTREELQAHIHKLRLKLESVEEEHQACVEALKQEQARVKQLQEELHQERLSSKHTQESLRASMSEHVAHLSELNATLEQEHVTVSNLRAELQIEQSRCEALLAQERERTELALSHLNEERSRVTELSRLLSDQAQEHARRLEKEVRSREAASTQDKKFIQELRAQLEQERRQAEELATMVDCLQAQVLEGKRRQEDAAQQEAQRGQEEVKRLQSALEALQEQRTEVSRSLETERRRAARLQTELDAMKEKMREVKEKERTREEQREKQRLRGKREEDKERGCTMEKAVELEELRNRMQQTRAGLEQQQKQRLTSERLHRDLHVTDSTHVSHTQDSSVASSSLLERVLKENSELAEHLAALNEEKIALKRTISCLERDLHNLKRTEQAKSSAQLDPSALSEKPGWQKEKAALQAALRKAEEDLVKASSRNENRPITELPNNKVQRLYEKYLRAESYRKSLVYQKRYLLLLLGGFQDCEQATLALIARMGAQPSLVTQASRPISRFRSAVRVLIAISRLKFLTRKWQRATKKSSTGNMGSNGAASRLEVLKPQQSGAAFNSPPTRDHILTQRTVISPLMPPVKSPFRLHNGGYCNSILAPSVRTLTPSQEQERSLADYIHHLENVQQRLGTVRPGSPAAFSFPRKTDR